MAGRFSGWFWECCLSCGNRCPGPDGISREDLALRAICIFRGSGNLPWKAAFRENWYENSYGNNAVTAVFDGGTWRGGREKEEKMQGNPKGKGSDGN